MAVKIATCIMHTLTMKVLKKKVNTGGVVTTIMKHLLENNVVDGIVAVKEGFDLYDDSMSYN